MRQLQVEPSARHPSLQLRVVGDDKLKNVTNAVKGAAPPKVPKELLDQFVMV